MDEKNFKPEVKRLFESLMQEADCILFSMSKIVEGGKTLIILSVSALGVVFLTQLAAPFPWNFISLGFMLLIVLSFLMYNGYTLHKFERLKTLLSLIYLELADIAPLMQQEFVKSWQWDALVARKGNLLRLHGLIK